MKRLLYQTRNISQPDTWAKTLELLNGVYREIVDFQPGLDSSRLIFTGCGLLITWQWRRLP